MRAQIITAITFALLYPSILGCNNDKKPKQSMMLSQEGDSSSETTQLETTEVLDKTPKVPKTAPAQAPLSHFGKLDFPRLDSPPNIAAIPNGSIAIIVIDAQNAKHFGAYGYERNTSPNLDALAKRGVLLTNYVSNSSWTRPSFTTILTGLPKRVHKNELTGKPLRKDIETLAERMKKLGYRTAAFIGNPLIRKEWNYGQGFDKFEDIVTMKTKAYPPDRKLIDGAISWLRKKSDKPFFLVFFLTAPHPPYRPPSKPRTFLSSVTPGNYNDHPFKEYKSPLPTEEHDRIVAAYDDEIAYMDTQVGRFIEYLEQSGHMGKTSILVTADHGEIFGEHNCYLHAYHMWEGALRVPFILYSPNLLESGVSDDRPFTHVDIAPTVFDLIEQAHPKDGFHGLSILADHKDIKDRILFSQYNAHGVRRQAVRNARYKLIHHHKVPKNTIKRLDELHPNTIQAHPKDLPSLAFDKERFELYDLVDDPKELNNLLGLDKFDSTVESLKEELNSRLMDGPLSSPELPAETIEALKNAGYIR